MKTGTTLITIIPYSLHQRAVHSSECETPLCSEFRWIPSTSGVADWLSVGETRAQQN